MLVNFSEDELIVLRNCVNEAIEAIDDFELQTRTGWDRAELLQLIEKLRGAALEELSE